MSSCALSCTLATLRLDDLAYVERYSSPLDGRLLRFENRQGLVINYKLKPQTLMTDAQRQRFHFG
jgi:hypothetical protein